MQETTRENLAQTLKRDLPVPQILGAATPADSNVTPVALPEGWKIERIDNEQLLTNPRRTKTVATMLVKDAFIDYVKRHAKESLTTVWCWHDPAKGAIDFRALFDDHNPNGVAGWRDHKALFKPTPSVEWQRWIGKDSAPMTQEDFACFIEDNQQDIHGGEGLPDGGMMLKLALDFHAQQDASFKSAIRTQSGSVRMTFVQADTAQTVQEMQVFERFRIAIPVFRDDTNRYPIVARLRYRAPGGKLSFWYELIRPDLVFEQSSNALIAYVRDGCGLPFFFGNPGDAKQ